MSFDVCSSVRLSVTKYSVAKLYIHRNKWLNKYYEHDCIQLLTGICARDVIVRPLSTVGYTSVVASVIHSRHWSN